MHYIVSMSSEIIKYPQQWHFKVLSYLNIKGRSGGDGVITCFCPNATILSAQQIFSVQNLGNWALYTMKIHYCVCLIGKHLLNVEMLALKQLILKICLQWLADLKVKIISHKVYWEIEQMFKKHVFPLTKTFNTKSLSLHMLQKQQQDESQFLP